MKLDFSNHTISTTFQFEEQNECKTDSPKIQVETLKDLMNFNDADETCHRHLYSACRAFECAGVGICVRLN